MKIKKHTFSGILVGLLLICSIGLLWYSEGKNVNTIKAVKYNAWNSVE